MDFLFTLLFYIVLFAGIVAFILYTIWTFTDTDKKKRQYQSRNSTGAEEHTQNNNFFVDYSNVSDEDYKKFMLEKADGNNINLTQLYDQLYRQQKQLDKQSKYLENISFNTGFIAFVLLAVIIIRIILVVAGVQTANNILSMF